MNNTALAYNKWCFFPKSLADDLKLNSNFHVHEYPPFGNTNTVSIVAIINDNFTVSLNNEIIAYNENSHIMN